MRTAILALEARFLGSTIARPIPQIKFGTSAIDFEKTPTLLIQPLLGKANDSEKEDREAMTTIAGAEFLIAHRSDTVVALVDWNRPGTRSVTNAAEEIVAELHATGVLQEQLLVYRDTEAFWDEIKHDGHGKFIGFLPIRARSLSQLAFTK